jgi:hypothetical protein
VQAENGFNAYRWADWRGKKETARVLAHAMGLDEGMEEDSSHEPRYFTGFSSPYFIGEKFSPRPPGFFSPPRNTHAHSDLRRLYPPPSLPPACACHIRACTHTHIKGGTGCPGCGSCW